MIKLRFVLIEFMSTIVVSPRATNGIHTHKKKSQGLVYTFYLS